MADGVENDSCRIDGVPPPRSRLIEEAFGELFKII